MKNIQYWRRKSEQVLRESKNSFRYREHMIKELQQHISFHAYCCTVIDTCTHCSVGAVTEDSLEDIHHKIMELEYSEPDVNKYEYLVQSGQQIGRLSDTIGQLMSKSVRYEEVLQPNGFTDEIRAALMFQGQCYGFLTLFKKETNGDPYFQDAELEQVKLLIPLIGEALKAYHHFIIEERLPVREGEQGIIIFDQHLKPISMNDKALKLLSILRIHEQLSEPYIPKPIQAVYAKLLANKWKAQASLLVPIKETGYIAIRASFMKTNEQKQQIAISLNEASSKEMLSFLMTAYHLTAREKEVVFEVIKGIPTKEIAQNLAISNYTVQDHLKVIFQKVNVSNRNELVWKIFSRFQLD
ncbi:DNA-binding NarL/FixJ family response regulator [Bacillus pakistanensis]|uniref:DNA-binding NarL/FixJ family response regulator n=1 Tax=Rossellomorea pakistanensis TaxID=992288 RepID=A0ABS2NBX1_9BACI|nr:helix-turn-helix transcriptional regulator [Bacillus pakistanensis]MBM7585351.1 DNA-binding NarL/FixJ family response regulator [Bacillus pakistanensis]